MSRLKGNDDLRLEQGRPCRGEEARAKKPTLVMVISGNALVDRVRGAANDGEDTNKNDIINRDNTNGNYSNNRSDDTNGDDIISRDNTNGDYINHRGPDDTNDDDDASPSLLVVAE